MFPVVLSCCVVLLVYCTVPSAAPKNVHAVVLNSTLAEVHWDAVPHELIRGYLKGYKVPSYEMRCDR